MRRLLCAVLIAAAVMTAGCEPVAPVVVDEPGWPDGQSGALFKNGKFLEAMRALPSEMAAWEAYTEATGNTGEGAAGLLHYTVLSAVATRGDAQWGAILDDPDIPYEYKTEMVFEILEDRLGKGAVYLGNSENIIIPRTRPIDLNREMIQLPE